MDIKNVGRLPLTHLAERTPKTEDTETFKTLDTTDRDANGKQQFADNPDDDRDMADEEFQETMKLVENMDSIKSAQLVVKSIKSNGKMFLLLEDRTGKVVRRLTNKELRSLLKNKDRKTGQIYSKVT